MHDKKVAGQDKKDVIARRRTPTKQSPRKPGVERVPKRERMRLGSQIATPAFGRLAMTSGAFATILSCTLWGVAGGFFFCQREMGEYNTLSGKLGGCGHVSNTRLMSRQGPDDQEHAHQAGPGVSCRCPAEWRNGRRWGLKIPCPQGRMGSNPISATMGIK